MNRSLVGLALAALVASGCATRASFHRLRGDVAGLRADLTDLRHSQDLAARDVARVLAEVKSLDDRALELQAGIRQATGDVGRVRDELRRMDDKLDELRAMATAPLPAPAVAPAAGAEPRPAETVARVESAEQMYSAALTAFRSREHGQAVLDFLDLIAKYPRHPLASNAQYWIGEAYYVQRDYRQALVEFRKVIEIEPTRPKAADALVKVGLCFLNLHDQQRAREAWQRVVEEYPTSEAAATARSLLRTRARSSLHR